MKKLFFLGILGFGVIWLLGFFLYRVALAFVDMYDDYQLSKELKEIEAATAAKRQQQGEQRAVERERLEQVRLEQEAEQPAAAAVEQAAAEPDVED